MIKIAERFFWMAHNVTKQAIKDVCHAYKRFLKGFAGYPRFKSRKHAVPKFYQNPVKIRFTHTHVKLEGFADSRKKNRQKQNWIRLAEQGRIPTEGITYTNPRIKYDGRNWWITVGMEYEADPTIPGNEGIGIDLGIKELAVCSDETRYPNINKTRKVKKLEKRKRRLQRSISRK